MTEPTCAPARGRWRSRPGAPPSVPCDTQRRTGKAAVQSHEAMREDVALQERVGLVRHLVHAWAAGQWLALEAPDVVSSDSLKTCPGSQSRSRTPTDGCLLQQVYLLVAATWSPTVSVWPCEMPESCP